MEIFWNNNISSFATKVDLANLNFNGDTLDIDKLKHVRTNLSNLKSKVDKLDADKLVPLPVDLSILSDAVTNDGVKRMYIMLIKSIEDKVPDITKLATKTISNAEINEVKGEIPNITNLTTTSGLIIIDMKVTSISNFVKKSNTKINEVEKKITDDNHDKYINTLEFTEFTKENSDLRLKRENQTNKPK